MARRCYAWVFALVVLLFGPACHARQAGDPFLSLRAAYAARDADAAAAAYAEDGEVVYRYAGAEPERHSGRPAIAASFRSFFAGLAPAEPLGLDFRFLHRDRHGARGFYRLRVGESAYYGRFDVTFSEDGLFRSDTSSDASLEDFESAPVP